METEYSNKKNKRGSKTKKLWENPEYKKRMSLAHIGYKATKEHKEKMSNAHRGKKKPWAKNLPQSFKKGIATSKEIIKKISGKNHYNWKGGITPLRTKIWQSKEYKIWRESVFKRDNYTCVWCYQVGGKLNADHIKPFAYFPELRFAIDNGRTLCINCHRKTDTYGAKANRFKYE